MIRYDDKSLNVKGAAVKNDEPVLTIHLSPVFGLHLESLNNTCQFLHELNVDVELIYVACSAKGKDVQVYPNKVFKQPHLSLIVSNPLLIFFTSPSSHLPKSLPHQPNFPISPPISFTSKSSQLQKSNPPPNSPTPLPPFPSLQSTTSFKLLPNPPPSISPTPQSTFQLPNPPLNSHNPPPPKLPHTTPLPPFPSQELALI
ncbi:hypothetical protein Pmani_021730 [Petrolisthes manimaculis]|uniref:Uncharacterized protein n=1 Tax=Petrolisthes manimaculis TaxID=1843537 RepID=A0AAE1PFV0_9EUCA|nr:hypothetical protein Pmani_021730 [Petrolisthes manimaculis]